MNTSDEDGKTPEDWSKSQLVSVYMAVVVECGSYRDKTMLEQMAMMFDQYENWRGGLKLDGTNNNDDIRRRIQGGREIIMLQH